MWIRLSCQADKDVRIGRTTPRTTDPHTVYIGCAVTQTTDSASQDCETRLKVPVSALNCSTVTASTFTVTSATVPAAGTVTCSGATATFTPTAPLAANTTFTATLTTGVQNVAGSGLPSAYVWTFTTDTLPTVLSTVPANGATGVLLNQTIGATFSKAMNWSTLYSPATTFKVTGQAPLPSQEP
jgi:hypothetical protein